MSYSAIIGVAVIEDDEPHVIETNIVYQDGYREKLGEVLKKHYNDYYDALDLASNVPKGYKTIEPDKQNVSSLGLRSQKTYTLKTDLDTDYDQVVTTMKREFEDIVRKSIASIGYLHIDGSWWYCESGHRMMKL